MDLEQLQEQADKDLKINDSELDLESIKTPQLHNQYLKHLTKFKLMLSRAESELHIVKRGKWEYYTGKADPTVYAEKPFNLKILRQDVDKYIDWFNFLESENHLYLNFFTKNILQQKEI